MYIHTYIYEGGEGEGEREGRERGAAVVARGINRQVAQHQHMHRHVPFGTFLEDVGFKQKTQTDDDRDRFLSEDMLAVYPCISDQVSYHGQPKQILFLTRDTFGVLPAVAKLTYEQAFYYYLSGYTKKRRSLLRRPPSLLATKKNFLLAIQVPTLRRWWLSCRLRKQTRTW